MDEIPGELIINWDQTVVNYILVSSWTVESEGTKKVEIIAKDDTSNYYSACWVTKR